jgi:biopolymer transport protein ExbB/TolQ
LESIAKFYQEGGQFMYVITIALVFGIAIAIERIIFVSLRSRINTNAFVKRVIEMIQSGNLGRAVEYCRRSKAALPQITRAGLEQADSGGSEQDIQNAFELAAMTEIPKLEKRTHYLSMIANVATLLGLLGTIFGLIRSFQAVAQADAAQKAALLSGGISQAMNTTAFGLIVAIPCLILYTYIQEKTNALIDEINENVARIYQNITMQRG